MTRTITCSRFDNVIASSESEEINKIKIKNTRKLIPLKKLTHALSTDGVSIFDSSGREKIEEYKFDSICNTKTIIVLTDKELEFLLKWAVKYNIEIISFESSFPIFDDIKYNQNTESSYFTLLRKIKIVRSFGISENSIAEHYSKKIYKKLHNKIKVKTNLDKYFAHAYTSPYQEVFRLAELREGRTVIALDFNSMFSFCMLGEFAEPSELYNIKLNREYHGEILSPGLYNVTLENPNCDFIKKFHPFRYCLSTNSISFQALDETNINIQLFPFEIEYYSRLFQKIYLHDAVISNNKIGHPCYSELNRLYRLRKRAKKSNNKPLERLYKYKLAMLHSGTNPRRYSTKTLASIRAVVCFLKNEFWLNIADENPLIDRILANKKYFKLSRNGNNFKIRYLDISNSSSVYSLSAQVTAKCRMIVTQTIEKFLEFPSLEICYVNTDSIHISIPKESHNQFITKFSHLIGDNIGQLKIQAFSDKALWLDLGHYYLIENNLIKLYKNSFLNSKGSVNPFIYARKIYAKIELFNKTFITEKLIKLPQILSSKKKIKQTENSLVVDFERFSPDEIFDRDSMKISILSEKIKSTKIKLQYLKLIKNK